MTDNPQGQSPTPPDTGKLREIVDRQIQARLQEALQDRPTKYEVQVMISQSVSDAIDNMYKKLSDERKEQNASLEKLLESKIASMQTLVTNMIGAVDTFRKDVEREVLDLRTKYNGMDTRLDLASTSITVLNRDVYGPADGTTGHDSLFKLMRDIRTDVQGLSPRIAALEAQEIQRQEFRQRLVKVGSVVASKEGAGAIGAIIGLIVYFIR